MTDVLLVKGNKTMPRPKSKRLLRAQEQFKAAVTTYLESIGTRPGAFYDLELNTLAGMLHVSVYDGWVDGALHSFGRPSKTPCRRHAASSRPASRLLNRPPSARPAARPVGRAAVAHEAM